MILVFTTDRTMLVIRLLVRVLLVCRATTTRLPIAALYSTVRHLHPEKELTPIVDSQDEHAILTQLYCGGTVAHGDTNDVECFFSLTDEACTCRTET